MCKYLVVERPRESFPLLIVGEFEAEGPARQAAEELAEANPKAFFEVYQFFGQAILQPKVIWTGAKP